MDLISSNVITVLVISGLFKDLYDLPVDTFQVNKSAVEPSESTARGVEAGDVNAVNKAGSPSQLDDEAAVDSQSHSGRAS